MALDSLPYSRPLIEVDRGVVMHNGKPTRVVLRKTLVSVGCTDVTLAAIEHILAQHKMSFGEKEVVLQSGADERGRS